MPVSGMSMEPFESSIRAIVRVALGQRAGPSGVMPLQSSLLDVGRKTVPSSSNFGPIVARLSGPAVPEIIDSEVPGNKEACKYTSRQ